LKQTAREKLRLKKKRKTNKGESNVFRNEGKKKGEKSGERRP